jgi:NitT/TauT family transport system substrate-binding protein
MADFERPERLRLMDTFRNLFYTPIYVAVAGGFLYYEGLDVMFSIVPAGQSAIALLKSGEADIIQTGISRSMMALDQGNQDAPLHIAEINQRDGFFLLSRQPANGWQWSDLEGATLIPFGFTPVPWMPLKAILKKHGVDIQKIRLLEGLSAEDALGKFRSGDTDYIHMLNPQAQQPIEDGTGHLATALGPELGHICYSSFAATPDFLESKPQVAERFVRGFYKAQQWLAENDVSAVADSVAPFFPSTSKTVLENSIRRYRSQDTWAKAPLIVEDSYNAMRDILIEGGLIKGRHPYQRLVQPEFAHKAMVN